MNPDRIYEVRPDQVSELAVKILGALGRENVPLEPTWMTVEVAAKWSGLTPTIVKELINKNLIVSSEVTLVGVFRSRTVVSRRSLGAFIEAGIGGGATLLKRAGKIGDSPESFYDEDAKSLAARYGVSPTHINKLAAQKIIRGLRVGDIWRFNRDEVHAAIIEHTESRFFIRKKPSKKRD